MNKKIKYLIKNTGILTVSNFASKIMIFLLVPIYTRALTTAEYGVYDLVVSTVQLIFPILTLNIVDAVMRFSMDEASSIDDIAIIGIRYIFRSFIPVILFGAICSYSGIFRQIEGFEGLIILYYLFYAINQFFIQFAKGLEKIFDMGMAGILSTVILLGGTAYYLFVLSDGLHGFFRAAVLSQATPCLYFFIRLKIWKYISFVPANKHIRNEMLLYSIPLLCTTLSWWVNNVSDRYVVALICGASANGILSVSYKIPSILNTMQQIFVQAWQISAIKEYGRNDTKSFYGKTFVLLNLLMCIFCSGLMIFSKLLAYLLYANDFFIAWKYVPFLLIASVLNSASGFVGPILLAAKDTKSMARSAVYGTVANLILNVVLVYASGIQGATIATAISSYVIYAVRKKAIGDKIKVEQYWKVIVTWIILFAQAIFEICTAFYIIQIFLASLILMLNRKNFILIFENLKKVIKK